VFTLYTTPLSANGRKPLALCHALGLEPEIRLVNVYAGEGRAPEFLAVNPLGKIPALVDGDFTLVESNAMLMYIAEQYGRSRFWSAEPRARAEILRWLFWEASAWQPALSTVLAACVGHRLLPSVVPAPSAPPEWKHPQLAPLLAFLDAALARSAFLCGSELTIADLSVAGMTTYFRHAEFPSAAWPNLEAWLARVEALEPWQASADPLWR
jgi:glutathione S-transferase